MHTAEPRIEPALPPATLKNSLFELLVQSVTDYAIYFVSPQGHVMTWNPGAERAKGYKAEEIVGSHFSRFYTREDCALGKPAAIVREAAENGRVQDEGWRVRKDGSLFWALVVMTAMRDDSGKLIGFAKVTRDLTERRRSEEALCHANETLENRVSERTSELVDINRDLKLFGFIISHDLRESIEGVLLYADLLQREGNLDARQNELLGKMITCGQRMNSVVQDVLRIWRLARMRPDNRGAR